MFRCNERHNSENIRYKICTRNYVEHNLLKTAPQKLSKRVLSHMYLYRYLLAVASGGFAFAWLAVAAITGSEETTLVRVGRRHEVASRSGGSGTTRHPGSHRKSKTWVLCSFCSFRLYFWYTATSCSTLGSITN